MLEIQGDIIENFSEARSDYVLIVNGKIWALYEKTFSEYVRIRYASDFIFFGSDRVAVINCGNITIFRLPCSEMGPPGPKGFPGTPGKNGLPGNPGISGSSGLKGLRGSPGISGSSGKRGPSGSEGLPGPSGAPGLNGHPGPSGRSGLSGKPGPSGAPGSDGRPGISGTNGNPGPSGVPGLSGPPGASGPRGISGSPGLPGLSGAPGRKGISGSPGLPGLSGAPGKNGLSGSPGLSGPQGLPGLSGGCNCTSGYGFIWNIPGEGQTSLAPYPSISSSDLTFNSGPVLYGMASSPDSLIIQTAGYYSGRYSIYLDTNFLAAQSDLVSAQLLQNGQVIPGSEGSGGTDNEGTVVFVNGPIYGGAIFHANVGDVIQLANNSNQTAELVPSLFSQYPQTLYTTGTPTQISGSQIILDLTTDTTTYTSNSVYLAIGSPAGNSVINIQDDQNNSYSRAGQYGDSELNNEVWRADNIQSPNGTLTITITFTGSADNCLFVALELGGTDPSNSVDGVGSGTSLETNDTNVHIISDNVRVSNPYDYVIVSVISTNPEEIYDNGPSDTQPLNPEASNSNYSLVIGFSIGFTPPQIYPVGLTVENRDSGTVYLSALAVSILPETIQSFGNPVNNAYLNLVLL